jgi:hypothetical protein
MTAGGLPSGTVEMAPKILFFDYGCKQIIYSLCIHDAKIDELFKTKKSSDENPNLPIHF